MRDQAQSRAYFERAIALDSTLVPAYIFLAVTYSNAGAWDSSEAVTRRLEAFKDRFTPYEHTLYDWQVANLSGNDERQLAAAQAIVARDSTPAMLYLVGLHANATGRPHVALPALERGDSGNVALGWAQQVTVLANAYHLLDRHEDALVMLRRRRANFPASNTIPGAELRALGALGRRDEALALADTLLLGITNNAGNQVTTTVLAGALEFEAHHQDTATAFLLARRVIKWHQDHPAPNAGPGRLQQEGRAWLLLGGLDSAERAFRRLAARDSNSIGARGHLALTLALKGDSVRARALADSIGAVQGKWLFGAPLFWRGAVLGALGDREAAVRLLQQSFSAGQAKGGLHYSLPLRSLRGYPPFEAMIKPER